MQMALATSGLISIWCLDNVTPWLTALFSQWLLDAMSLSHSSQSHAAQVRVEVVLCGCCGHDALPFSVLGAVGVPPCLFPFPKISSAGEGSLLSIDVTLTCSNAICRSLSCFRVFFTIDLMCRTCLSMNLLLFGQWGELEMCLIS